MAVDGCLNPVIFEAGDDDDDDDDGPVTFKRQKPSDKGKGLPQKSALPTGEGASIRNANGESSTLQKNKAASTSNPSGDKLTSPGNSGGATRLLASRPPNQVSDSRLKNCAVDKSSIKRPYPECNDSGDRADDSKPLRQSLNKGKQSNNIKKMNVDKASASQKESIDGLDDDKKPLNVALPSVISNNGSISVAPKNAQVCLPSSHSSIKDHADDSEDDKPLASRFSLKASPSVSAKLKEKQPIPSIKPESSIKRESGGSMKSPATGNKRQISDANNSFNTESKRLKISDGSSSGKVKHETKTEDDTDDELPLSKRIKTPASSDGRTPVKNSMKRSAPSSCKDRNKVSGNKMTKTSQFSKSVKAPPGSGGGKKWTTLEHNGVIFPPEYKPHGIKMLYDGKYVDLSPEQEEVATMFAVMKDTEYATKPKFIENFFTDWKKILGKNHVIKKFELCDFTPIYEWHLAEKEKKKQMTTQEKKLLKEEKMQQEEKYMWAVVDGVKEKVGNFRVEPPGLFRGRGEHPKMGKLKRRIRPRDITINIGKGTPVPSCPIPGEKWKEVKHDNTVTWLAFWNDPINPKEFKYVFLAASSSLKGQSDKEKYEKSRLLKDYIHNIRANYSRDFTSKDATKRQIAVATYLIDKLALRAGNEKDDDEAETVGCCTLKVENVVCIPPNKLQLDFLGKDSIRYYNTVEVELPVYKAIEDFRNAKKSDGKRKGDGDDLFDLLDTSKLNAHLRELMPGLTAKVFRTYNASITLDDILNKETKGGNVLEKAAVYQRANKEVAIICNHQRAVSKNHENQMSKLNERIEEQKAIEEELKVDLDRARKGKAPLKDKDGKPKRNLTPEALEKKLDQVNKKIEKMEKEKLMKEDLKTVALGTSKINYLDPRITVAWCKRHEVPIEKIFNKSLLAKFAWAMDVDPDYRF